MQNIKTIKVGTFNLMNLMLPDKPAYGGTLYYSQSEYARKAKWVEFMLNQMDADVICFQELFHREALTRIIKNMPKYRRARLYVANENGDQPCVALLSRYPVENVEVYEEFPEEAVIDFNPKGKSRVVLPFTTFTRPVLKADIRIDGYGLITFFSVHLKSKREIYYVGEDEQNPVDVARAQSRSLMLRASESVALRALIAESLRIPERPVVVCGDVNDIGTSVTSRIISGDVPEHRLSDRVKKRIWDVLLYHVKDIQARRSYQDFYYTHIHNGMYESLDHIMVSQELVMEYPRNTGRVGLVSVYNDHLVDQTFTSQKQDKCKSDHGVVVCSLELDLDRAKRYMTPENSEYPEDDEYEDDRYIQRQTEEIVGADMLDAVYDTVDEAAIQESQEQLQEEKIEEEPEVFDFRKSLDKWQERNPRSGKSGFNRRNKRFTGFNKEEERPQKRRDFRREKSNDILDEPGTKSENRRRDRNRSNSERLDKPADAEKFNNSVKDTKSKEIVTESKSERPKITITNGGRERRIRRGSIEDNSHMSSFYMDDDLE